MTVSGGRDLETALRESEDRYRQLTESLPQLVWACTAEGECDYLSPQWVAYTGEPAETHLKLGWMEKIHPTDRAAAFAAWSAAVGAGRPFQCELRIRRHGGQYRWFEARALPQRDVRNQIVKWFGATRDVHEARETRLALETEGKRLSNLVALAPALFCSYALRTDGSAHFPYVSAGIVDLYAMSPEDLREDASPAYEAARSRAAERAMHQTLAANQEGLRLALQSSAIGIWERNLITGEIEWDTRAKSIFGVPPAFKMEATALMACVHPDDRAMVQRKAEVSRDPLGDGRFEMEYRIQAVDDGGLRYIYGQGLTFFEGQGDSRRAGRAIGTLPDITALKAGGRALRIANKELEDFAYVASHDLKAPLRVIHSAVQWLEEDLAGHLSDETREHMNLLRGRGRRREKLLDDLMEYAGIGRKTKSCREIC